MVDSNLAGFERTELPMSAEEEVGEGSTSMVISSDADDDEGASTLLPSAAAIVFPLVADLATSALPFVIIPSADHQRQDKQGLHGQPDRSDFWDRS